ncbi:hypothetical protein RUM44_000187 [Polyplax serrata]|uniref:Uncharacterized protein n=1 Tax=Polyplax serrata TaxID=468196 RepID=A0ABR1B4R3_POLSC
MSWGVEIAKASSRASSTGREGQKGGRGTEGGRKRTKGALGVGQGAEGANYARVEKGDGIWPPLAMRGPFANIPTSIRAPSISSSLLSFRALFFFHVFTTLNEVIFHLLFWKNTGIPRKRALG